MQTEVMQKISIIAETQTDTLIGKFANNNITCSGQKVNMYTNGNYRYQTVYLVIIKIMVDNNPDKAVDDTINNR